MAKDVELTFPGITISKTKQPMWDPPSKEAFNAYRVREAVMCFRAIGDAKHPANGRSRELQLEDTLFSPETWRVARQMRGNPV